MRNLLNFNDGWVFSKDGTHWQEVNLPHTWNAKDGQDGGNDYHRGTCTYVKEFAKPAHEGSVILEFLGAAMSADVVLNGKNIAHHEGGYSTFRCDITNVLQEKNRLSVSVDNSVNDYVYPQKADFTFYGGLYRAVNLILVPHQHFDLVLNGTPGIKVTPVVNGKNAKVTVETWAVGEGEVTVVVDNQIKTVSVMQNKAVAEFVIENVHLWDGVEDPFLYTAVASFGEDQVSARFGCRTIEFNAERGFFLNGREYPLRGVSRHQDWKDMGNALTTKEHQEDMAFIREIGANTVRLAHYQHAQEFYDLCDENGIVVWAEIPYITAHMPNGRKNTVSQMTELVTQCYNHPSIVCWGLSNEITAAGTVDEDLMENHRILHDLCHNMDATRPTTMAHVFMLETDSPLIQIPDIGSYNLYFGWYLGELAQNDAFFDAFHKKFPNQVMGFSEYGADANPQYQSANPEKGDYSEAYQAIYHEHLIKCIEERPYIWASHAWNLFDFAADGRNEGGKCGENQKGLVTFDRSYRKDAFYLYKAAWNKEPMLHLCGKSYVERETPHTQIKVYSNCTQVTLYVDGVKTETKNGKRVFIFEIEITGEHKIEVYAGQLHDEMVLRKVEKANPNYCMVGSEVVNWFDKDTFNPNCFSIKDTLGVLMENPRASAIVGRMMEAARASRGDVASATAGNKSLEKMMAGMTLQSLLKQAGPAIKPEQIQTLNATLQQISKNDATSR